MTDQPIAPVPDSGEPAADVPPPPSPADAQTWAASTGEGSPAVGPGKRPTWVLPVVTGVIGLVVGAGGMAAIGAGQDAAQEREVAAESRADQVSAATAQAARAETLTKAVGLCGQAESNWFVVADEGLSLTFDNKGKEDYLGGADFQDIECVLDVLEAPAAVLSHMGQTTSMDGRQEESWDGITVAWSYHPDRGMDGVVTVKEAE
ncbi:hypothetical protein [Oerskovia enterophila]|uniref:hypothetical protein n=1 Tax=Oerskovia enterophila TaxID=43678 RepID=UPI003827424C